MAKEKAPKVVKGHTHLLNAFEPYTSVAGVDEVGRGCLAGCVVAAAVILPADFYHPKLRDSKKMTLPQREEAALYIKENAIAYSIQEVSPAEIDSLNILQASWLAMDKAIKALSYIPDHILVDGNAFYNRYHIEYTTVIKGDDTYAAISAAACLAKVYRDHLMTELDAAHPQYDWKGNKGYGTAKHIAALKEFGATPYHRKTFIKNFVEV